MENIFKSKCQRLVAQTCVGIAVSNMNTGASSCDSSQTVGQAACSFVCNSGYTRSHSSLMCLSTNNFSPTNAPTCTGPLLFDCAFPKALVPCTRDWFTTPENSYLICLYMHTVIENVFSALLCPARLSFEFDFRVHSAG